LTEEGERDREREYGRGVPIRLFNKAAATRSNAPMNVKEPPNMKSHRTDDGGINKEKEDLHES
jgi:hypothetical protein